MRIQYGTSICYPMSSQGSHISASPNHQTHRTSTLKTRFLVALSGTFGCEFDMAAMSSEEANELRELIMVRQRFAPLIQNADLYRLWSPFDRSTPTSADRAAWMFVGREGREAVVMAFLITKVSTRLQVHLLVLVSGSLFHTDRVFCPNATPCPCIGPTIFPRTEAPLAGPADGCAIPCGGAVSLVLVAESNEWALRDALPCAAKLAHSAKRTPLAWQHTDERRLALQLQL